MYNLWDLMNLKIVTLNEFGGELHFLKRDKLILIFKVGVEFYLLFVNDFCFKIMKKAVNAGGVSPEGHKPKTG